MARQKRTSKTMRGFAATRGPRDIIKQAHSDLERGLVDTGRRGAVRSIRKKKG
jgi:hypothetical protein